MQGYPPLEVMEEEHFGGLLELRNRGYRRSKGERSKAPSPGEIKRLGTPSRDSLACPSVTAGGSVDETLGDLESWVGRG